jgi:hypothetical protein
MSSRNILVNALFFASTLAGLFIHRLIFVPFFFVSVYCLVTAYDFYRSRDGELRRILLSLFVSFGLHFGLSGFLYFIGHLEFFAIGNIICLIPDFLSLRWLRSYFRKTNGINR